MGAGAEDLEALREEDEAAVPAFRSSSSPASYSSKESRLVLALAPARVRAKSETGFGSPNPEPWEAVVVVMGVPWSERERQHLSERNAPFHQILRNQY